MSFFFTQKARRREGAQRRQWSIILQNILFVYTFGKSLQMKNLSLKMDDLVFNETEKITARIHKNRNRYINEAVEFYNLLQKEKYFQGSCRRNLKSFRKNRWKYLQNLKSWKMKIKQYDIWIADLNPQVRYRSRQNQACSYSSNRFIEQISSFKYRLSHYY